MTLREARKLRRLSARELAELVGVTENTVLRWERGEIEPSRQRLEEVAAALEMRLRYVVEFTAPD